MGLSSDALSNGIARIRMDSIWEDPSEPMEIGVTNTTVFSSSKSFDTANVLYEVTLHFPRRSRLWRLHRSLEDFADMDTSLRDLFSEEFNTRHIEFPTAHKPISTWRTKAVDVTVFWRRSNNSENIQALNEEQADKVRTQLNQYLHRLLEVEPVIEHEAFQSFVTPIPDSEDRDVVGQPSCAMPNKLMVSQNRLRGRLSDALLAPALKVLSNPEDPIKYGGEIHITAFGGLPVSLSTRGGVASSTAAAAVAVGIAGAALGPISAALMTAGAVGGGIGNYRMNKADYLTIQRPRVTPETRINDKPVYGPPDRTDLEDGTFRVESVGDFASRKRLLRFGDYFRLRIGSKIVQMKKTSASTSALVAVENTTNESYDRPSIFRLVSPSKESGPVTHNSYVYLQAIDDNSNSHIVSTNTIGDRALTCDSCELFSSPTVFRINSLSAPSRPAPESTRPSFSLRLAVYNVWLMPKLLSSLSAKLSPNALRRAQAIPPSLERYNPDIVVFCEAFCSSSRKALVSGMKERGFLYETRAISADKSLLTMDGGVLVMSKHPIESVHELTFGDLSAGDDKYADKGVVYCKLNVGGETVHVFATHLQAWNTNECRDVRKRQLELMDAFTQSMGIAQDEAVVFAGDFNVDATSDEYADMLTTLDAMDVPLDDESSTFSFDPLRNELAKAGPSSDGIQERLDYVLVPKKFRQTTRATCQVLDLKASKDWSVIGDRPEDGVMDLSDHFPVLADLHF